MTNLDSILKSRNITLPTKVHLIKAMVFPVVMYGCESWTIKKAEHQRIDAFELWHWRRLLWVLWTARRSNQYILKEISPECSLEGLKLKLKLQYFGHLMRRTESLEKTLMLGKTEGRRRRGWQRMRWLTSDDSMDMRFCKPGVGLGGRWCGVGDGQRSLACCSPWGCKELDVTELNWTWTNIYIITLTTTHCKYLVLWLTFYLFFPTALQLQRGRKDNQWTQSMWAWETQVNEWVASFKSNVNPEAI